MAFLSCNRQAPGKVYLHIIPRVIFTSKPSQLSRQKRQPSVSWARHRNASVIANRPGPWLQLTGSHTTFRSARMSLSCDLGGSTVFSQTVNKTDKTAKSGLRQQTDKRVWHIAWLCTSIAVLLELVCRDPSEHRVAAGRNREYMVATTAVEGKQRSCCAVLQYRDTKTYNYNSTVTARVQRHLRIIYCRSASTCRRKDGKKLKQAKKARV